MGNVRYRVDRADQTRIVQNLFQKVKEFYLFPEQVDDLCSQVMEQLASADYADINDGEFFAYALTTYIQAITRDEHFWVKFHSDVLPDQGGSMRNNPDWIESQRLLAEQDNYGFHKVERLPGNIGYVDIHYFHRTDWSGNLATAAMNFIANMNALIIDLRKCLGGYPDMVNLVSSYLFGEQPVHFDSVYWRDQNQPQEFWTLDDIPGKRFVDKPVFLLISKTTFSAGEGFAYGLQAQQRAVLVGEKTDGGAHLVASFTLHPHFEASIPIGRSINPVTKKNWQGCGVIPDFEVPEDQSFDLAYRLALEAVLNHAGRENSKSFEALVAEAKLAYEVLNK